MIFLTHQDGHLQPPSLSRIQLQNRGRGSSWKGFLMTNLDEIWNTASPWCFWPKPPCPSRIKFQDGGHLGKVSDDLSYWNLKHSFSIIHVVSDSSKWVTPTSLSIQNCRNLSPLLSHLSPLPLSLSPLSPSLGTLSRHLSPTLSRTSLYPRPDSFS